MEQFPHDAVRVRARYLQLRRDIGESQEAIALGGTHLPSSALGRVQLRARAAARRLG
jgi:hypothetical protein